MRRTQYAIFEIGEGCNLGAQHERCPNRAPERFADSAHADLMTDDQILAGVRALKDLGFGGLVGFHYFNEPTLEIARLRKLSEAVRRMDLGLILWTNGCKIDELTDAELGLFQQVHFTDYGALPHAQIARARRFVREVKVHRWELDGRLNAKAAPHLAPCFRPFSEIIFNARGDARLCCVDWRGECKLGNLRDDPMLTIVNRFLMARDAISDPKMRESAPEVCKACACRLPKVSRLLNNKAIAAEQWLQKGKPADDASAVLHSPRAFAREVSKKLRKSSDFSGEVMRSADRPAVVFVSYRVPEHRLRDHFKWNDEYYRASGIRAYVVTDREYDGLPSYARCLVFTEDMPKFNLAKTSNYGIRAAIESGHGVIIKTDVDICFSRESWAACVRVQHGHSCVPIYRMSHGYDVRATRYDLAPKATGTVAMVADDWRRAHFDERCVGYGCDDALLLEDIRQSGITIDRCDRAELWHIAHQEGTPQKEFNHANPRTDHWGRADGFNPENFRENAPLRRDRSAAKDPRWGLAGFSDVALVLTHWHLPKLRLRSWIEWNAEEVARARARVVVVSDDPHENLPTWMRVAIYPKPDLLEPFNLARTSNWGIRLVGQGIVCKTDPDVVLHRDAFDAIAAVTPHLGYCPEYVMSSTWDDARRKIGDKWPASKGTMALHWDHWSALCGYDERMQGYGIEDGDGFERARTRCGDRRVLRDGPAVYHVAHHEGAEQLTQFGRRVGTWNPGENPKNHSANRRVQVTGGAWMSEAWGIA